MNVTLTVNGQSVSRNSATLPVPHSISTLWSSDSTLDSNYQVQRTFNARPANPPRPSRRPTVFKRAARRSRRFVRYSVAALLLLSTGFSAPVSSRDAIEENQPKRLEYPRGLIR